MTFRFWGCSENGKEITLRERYTNPIRKQGKEVVYFVAVVRGEQEVRLQEKEVESARWVGWEEGRGLITFEECREMLGIVAKALDATIGGEGEEGKEEGGVKAKV